MPIFGNFVLKIGFFGFPNKLSYSTSFLAFIKLAQSIDKLLFFSAVGHAIL